MGLVGNAVAHPLKFRVDTRLHVESQMPVGGLSGRFLHAQELFVDDVRRAVRRRVRPQARQKTPHKSGKAGIVAVQAPGRIAGRTISAIGERMTPSIRDMAF